MVGDSAVTRLTGKGKVVTDDAYKVQYAEAANVGFALWGNAGVDHRRIDYWLDDFIRDEVNGGDSVEHIGQKLATSLNEILTKSGRPWKNLVRGIHIAGYRDGLPVLFHLHCGHENEPPHELRLYQDYPDDQKWTEAYFRSLLNDAFIHLRNGYHKLFGPLFDRALEYAAQLRGVYNIQLPYPSVEARFEFYKVLVTFVAGTLIASNLDPSVNDKLSSIAFGSHGLIIDQRLPVIPPAAAIGSTFDEYLEST
jgi:hypothetical protein